MHVHRTKRGRILEYWALFFLNVRPYRCGKCRLRFYGPKKFSSDKGQFTETESAAAVDAAQRRQHDEKSTRSSRR